MRSPTASAGRGDFGRGRPITPDLRAARRSVIIESAYAVLTERGYERTSMSDIARHAGVGQATVYRYFESKRELLDHVFDYAVLKVFRAVNLRRLAGRAEPAATELITVLGQNLFDLVDQDPAILRVITVESSAIDPELRYRVIGLFSTLDANLAQLFEHHVPGLTADCAQVRVLGRMMLGSAAPGLLMSLTMQGSDKLREEFLTTMESVATHGLFGLGGDDAAGDEHA